MKALLETDTRYKVILADPPWNYSNTGTNGAGEKHYKSMKPAELQALPVAELSADDAILLLWATWPTLDTAFDLVRAWGFRYKTGLPWIKLQAHPFVDMFGNHVEGAPAYGNGFWFKGCTEPILLAVRGKVDYSLGGYPLGLLSKRFEHSRKPDNLHDYAERFPGPYLELFARRSRPGWTTWGDQVPTQHHI